MKEAFNTRTRAKGEPHLDKKEVRQLLDEIRSRKKQSRKVMFGGGVAGSSNPMNWAGGGGGAGGLGGVGFCSRGGGGRRGSFASEVSRSEISSQYSR